MTQLSPTALEEAAKAVRQSRNKCITPPTEGTEYDAALATAAITAYLAQAEKEGWVMVPKEPTTAMIEAGDFDLGSEHTPANSVAATKQVYAAMLAAAQNGGE